MHIMKVIQKKRKFIKKNTKSKLNKVLKELLIKWYLYSGQEIKRIWLEKREVEYYLKKYLKTQSKYNEYWNERKVYYINKDFEKLLNTRIKDLIIFDNKEIKNFLTYLI